MAYGDGVIPLKDLNIEISRFVKTRRLFFLERNMQIDVLPHSFVFFFKRKVGKHIDLIFTSALRAHYLFVRIIVFSL